VIEHGGRERGAAVKYLEGVYLPIINCHLLALQFTTCVPQVLALLFPCTLEEVIPNASSSASPRAVSRSPGSEDPFSKALQSLRLGKLEKAVRALEGGRLGWNPLCFGAVDPNKSIILLELPFSLL
jgi:hypothetical protein